MSITLFAYDPTLTVAGLGGTFTRADASTCATYVDSNGVVQTVAANVLRNSHYVNGVRTTLLEGSRQNPLLQSCDHSNAAWTKTRMTVTTGIADPAGGTSACTLTSTSGSGGNSWSIQNIGIGSSLVRTSSIWIRRRTGTGLIRLWAPDNATFSNLTVTSSWQKFQIANGAASTARTLEVDVLTENDAIDVWGAQIEDGAFASSTIVTGAAAVTRAADALSFPFLPVPQAMTVYADFYDLGTYATSNGGIGSVGGTTGASLQFYSNGSGIYNTFHSNGSTSVTKATGAAATFGDRVELRFPIQSDGSVLIGQSLNSGTETVSTTSAANTFASAWNATTVFVGQMSAGGFTGFAAFRSLKIASGVQSLATMRTL